MKIKESDLIEEVIVPYLQENWHSIDNIETLEKANGRLTREKLFIKYLRALSSGTVYEAIILESILERYDEICLAHEDAYIPEEEHLIGITEEDISVYQQKVCSATKTKFIPKRWLPLKAS